MSDNFTLRDGAVVARHAHNVEVAGSTPAPATTSLICRCKWCVARTGHPRYRVEEEWFDDLTTDVMELGNITDGICPECLALEKAKIKEAYG